MSQSTKDKTIKIDATDKVLGRLASEISLALRGKDSVDFSYHKLAKNKVTVYNAKNIIVTGKKKEQKKYYTHSGYLGSIKEITLGKLLKKDPSKVIKFAVKGMLPKNRLQNEYLKNLTIVNGDINAK